MNEESELEHELKKEEKKTEPVLMPFPKLAIDRMFPPSKSILSNFFMLGEQRSSDYPNALIKNMAEDFNYMKTEGSFVLDVMEDAERIKMGLGGKARDQCLGASAPKPKAPPPSGIPVVPFTPPAPAPPPKRGRFRKK
jgi:hypothetical protein